MSSLMDSHHNPLIPSLSNSSSLLLPITMDYTHLDPHLLNHNIYNSHAPNYTAILYLILCPHILLNVKDNPTHSQMEYIYHINIALLPHIIYPELTTQAT